MIHLPWVLFLIGNIGYQLYVYDPAFWFRQTNDKVNDDFIMVMSVFLSFIGLISSAVIYSSILIN